MIRNILEELSNESSTNKKVEILGKYKDNSLLKNVLYLANSKRIKFYIKQIPTYETKSIALDLEIAISKLDPIIKRDLTGYDAINHLVDILSHLHPDDAYIIERIIEKDCKINMGSSLINKVFPKLIEDTPYMGAKPYEVKLIKKLFQKGGRAFSQVKMDGRYCNAIIRGGEVEMESRQGEPTILDNAQFVSDLSKLGDCVLNGELTMAGIPRYISNGIIASLIDITKKRDERGVEKTQKNIDAFEKKHEMKFEEALNKIVFTVWDTISVDEYFNAVSSKPYTLRFENLNNIITKLNSDRVKVVESKIVNSFEEALAHFQEMLNRGEEGTILKDSMGTWKDGKPVWQIKFKLEMDVDLKIVGFNYGTGKNVDVISSLNCETSDGLVKTRPTGINEEMMQYITDNQETLLGAIIECKCCGLSWDSDNNYSLLHPVFKRIRDDKNTCDSLVSVIEIEKMCKGLI